MLIVDHTLPSPAAVIATGIETLAFTADLPMDWRRPAECTAKGHLADDVCAACINGPHMWRLTWLKEAAALDPDVPQFVMLNGRPYLVRGHGRRGYTFLLDGELASICITTAARMRPQFVELTAFATWSFTAGTAFTQARADLAVLVGAPFDEWATICSRADFTVDVQGWEPPPDMARGLVTRARKRREFDDEWWCPCGEPFARGGRFCTACGQSRELVAHRGTSAHRPGFFMQGVQPGETFYLGLDIEGFQWGAGGALMLRVYDKTHEIKKHRGVKSWFHDLWKCSDGYVEGLPVWRFEFQLRRNAFRDIEIAGRRISSVEDVLGSAGSIWRYLAGGVELECRTCGDVARAGALSCSDCGRPLHRRNGWAELRTPGRSRRARWPVSPLWRQLQAVYFEASGPAVPVARARKRAADSRALALQALGCLVGIAANGDVLGRLDRMSDIVDSDDRKRAAWRETMKELRYALAVEQSRAKPDGTLPVPFLERIRRKALVVKAKG